MPRIAVNVDDEDVFVCFGGLDILWTQRRTVRIPRTHVVGATVGPAPVRRGLRFPGTHFPGVLAAGTWRLRGCKELWNVRGGERVVVLAFTDEAEFRRIVLEVPDPEAVAAQFNLRRRRSDQNSL